MDVVVLRIRKIVWKKSYMNKSNLRGSKKRQHSEEGEPFEFFLGKRITQKILLGSLEQAQHKELSCLSTGSSARIGIFSAIK